MTSTSPPVTWDGLELNPLAPRADGVLPVVEDVTGWYDTPEYNGNDIELVLADGSLRGPKTAAARTVTISGSVTGPPAALATFRDLLAVRAAAQVPAQLAIPDAAGRLMSATVRCDSTGLKHTFAGPFLFSYQATVTAVDPRLYGPQMQVVLTNFAGGTTGWKYTRAYPRKYAAAQVPNSAILANQGTAPAPVQAVYAGDLGQSQLVDSATGNTIHFAAVAAGAQIALDTSTLDAWAGGGASRAAYVLPGSVPLLVPPMASASWSLYATGAGSLTLTWASAWQ